MGNISAFQLILPLLGLGLWALTVIFRRDVQPNPPGARRTSESGGPRPQQPFSPRPPERRPVPASQARPENRNRPVDRDTGIVIIETETRRPVSGNATRAPVGKAAKSKGAGAKKKGETPTPRALSSSVAKSMHPLDNRPMDLKPLAPVHAPLLSQEAHNLTQTAEVLSQSPSPHRVEQIDLRRLLSTHSKIRENLIISELLGPPLALRPRSFRR